MATWVNGRCTGTMRSAFSSIRGAGGRDVLVVGFVLACASASVARAADGRLEAGVGIVVSDHDLSFTERLGNVELPVSSNSALGGSGPLVSAGLWVDGLFFRDLTLGIEYLHSDTSSDLSFGLAGVGQVSELGSKFSLTTETVFANVAWRLNAGFVHPYVGLGLGVSWLDGEAKADVAVPGVSATPLRLVDFSKDVLAPSGQVFAGFDYDLTNALYVGAAARYYLIDGRLFGEDQIIRELSAQLKIGVRF